MRPLLAALAALLVFPSTINVGVGVVRGQERQEPKFKSGTQTVPLYVTVVDSTRRLVPDLTQDDFEVFDNGKPQAITLFDNEVRPITAVVMLDTSGSMTLALDFVKKGAEQFLIRLLPGSCRRVQRQDRVPPRQRLHG